MNETKHAAEVLADQFEQGTRGDYPDTWFDPEAAAMLRTIPALEAERDALQAKLDRIMLEYCPEEMTPAQVAEWGRHQIAQWGGAKNAAAEEREACAMLCNQIASSYNKDGSPAFEDVADYCATSIRARSKP